MRTDSRVRLAWIYDKGIADPYSDTGTGTGIVAWAAIGGDRAISTVMTDIVFTYGLPAGWFRPSPSVCVGPTIRRVSKINMGVTLPVPLLTGFARLIIIVSGIPWDQPYL